MKKTLVALAVLAVASVASAKSSLTLFGVVDVAYSGGSFNSSGTGGSFSVSQKRLSSGNKNPSRLGFRGVQDLGNSLSAGFWLEAGYNLDNGIGSSLGLFSRRATVSLFSNFGEIRVGRDFRPTYWNNDAFDPFGAVGVGTSLIQAVGTTYNRPFLQGQVNNIWASNAIGYILPKDLGGFYGQIQYALHERVKSNQPAYGNLNVGAARTGGGLEGRFGYQRGPVNVAVAYGQVLTAWRYTPNSAVQSDRKAKTMSFGGSYDFGAVKLMGQYSRLSDYNDFNGGTGVGATNNQSLTGYLLGIDIPVGVGNFLFSYGNDKTSEATVVSSVSPKVSKFALGYTHNFSKSTALYATYARVSNRNGSGISALSNLTPYTITGNVVRPTSSTGYDFGIRHSF